MHNQNKRFRFFLSNGAGRNLDHAQGRDLRHGDGSIHTNSWNPSDLYKIDMPQEMLEKQKEKAIKQALKLLISNGVIKDSDISVA